MSIPRKFILTELEWIDKYEPRYKETYVTHHFVPLTQDFNSMTKGDFSPTTVRNRLYSYRNWTPRERLRRGPTKSIDLCSPVKIIKKESKFPTIRHLEIVSPKKECWIEEPVEISSPEQLVKKEKVKTYNRTDKVKRGLSAEILEKETLYKIGYADVDYDSDDPSVKALYPDIPYKLSPNSFDDKGSVKQYRKSLMEYYISQEKENQKPERVRDNNPMSFQPCTSKSTRTNMDQITDQLGEKITKARIKEEKINLKKEKKLVEWEFMGWRHKINKKGKHTKTPEFSLYKNGKFECWKMTSQITSQRQALELFKSDIMGSFEPQDSAIAGCNCGCNVDSTKDDIWNTDLNLAPPSPYHSEKSTFLPPLDVIAEKNPPKVILPAKPPPFLPWIHTFEPSILPPISAAPIPRLFSISNLLN
jgi:hypothetical protein